MFQFLLRSIPAKGGDEGWAEAVTYAKSLKVYPLADAASPKPTGWFDVGKVEGYFHGTPNFGLGAFRLIDEYVQNEPVQEFDKVMHGMIAEIGIQKGKPFNPDARTSRILDQAAKDAERYMRGELENGRVFDRYWPGRTWGAFKINADIVRTLGTWNFPDRLDYQARAVNFYYWANGMPRRYAGAGGSTFYVMTPIDGQGKPLDGAKSYRLHVPAKVPMRDFWSLICRRRHDTRRRRPPPRRFLRHQTRERGERELKGRESGPSWVRGAFWC